MSHTIILGAGLIGAALAYRLTQRGGRVTVIEAGLPAGAASGRSFGWINASFALNEAHFALRVAGMAAHRRLAADLPGLHHETGCLWWEDQGPAFHATADRLEAAGYPLQRLTRAGAMAAEPALARPPDEALLFPTEAWVDPAALTHALLAASGALLLTGLAARPDVGDGGICGVETPLGPVAADRVVLATGTATPGLLAPLGLNLPMLHRPGLMLRTRPVGLRLRRILAAPEQEVRQDETGRLYAPAAAYHQSDTGQNLADPAGQARETLARIAGLLGLPGLEAEAVTHAERPVPGDGLPVVGPVGAVPGLWLAVLHSGVTLAAIVAEALAAEITGQGEEPLFAPFRPARLVG